MSESQKKQCLCGNFNNNCNLISESLRCKNSFDLVIRDLEFGQKKSKLYFVDGLVKDETMVKIITSLSSLKSSDLDECKSAKQFIDRYIPYIETEYSVNIEDITTKVLSGQLAFIIENINEVILIDARTYPTRSLQEPDSDRVLRGARDSFCETIIFNTALIRRHIRDPRLTMMHHTVGSVSKCDVVICYFEGRTDKKVIETLSQKIKALNIKTLSMAQESLTEALLPKRWYNPFPKARYT